MTNNPQGRPSEWTPKKKEKMIRLHLHGVWTEEIKVRRRKEKERRNSKILKTGSYRNHSIDAKSIVTMGNIINPIWRRREKAKQKPSNYNL